MISQLKPTQIELYDVPVELCLIAADAADFCQGGIHPWPEL